MVLLIWCVLLIRAALAARSTTESDVCSVCECDSKILNCSNRNISSVPPLKGLTNATTIALDTNMLTHVPVFPELSAKILSLAHNEITDIDDSAFKNMASLVALDLSFNLISTDKLLPNIFRGHYAPDLYEPLRSLKELNIANNMLHSLRPDVFEHLPNLEKLNMKENPLRIISHNTILAIGSVTFLKELNLSGTGLKQLPESLLHAPKYLELLDLSNNLFTMPPQDLENSHRLRWLSLNGNPIQRIAEFPRMEFLKVLHLSRMTDLIKIEKRALSTLPRLEEFYCSDNRKLQRIDKTAFSAMESMEEGEGEVWPPLKVIILRNNSLHSIDSHLVSRWDHLNVIDLQNNPWMCDCENQWLVSILTPMIEEKQPELLKFFKCQEPAEYRGTALITLENRDLCKLEKSWSLGRKALLVGFFTLILVIVLSVQIGILYYKKTIKNHTYRYQETMKNNFQSCHYSRIKGDALLFEGGFLMP